MIEELMTLTSNGTWQVVVTPPNANLLRKKWVYKKKLDKNGGISYRARLVCKGCTQTHGAAYDAIFSPGVHSPLRTVLALAANYGMNTRHLDVPKAYPNADIDYDCYMAAPIGTTLPPGKCNKLLKSLYGLKQAG